MAEDESIAVARIDIVGDTSQLNVAITAAQNRISAMSSDAQQAYAALNVAEKRRVDTLLKQADTIGYTRQQQILYNAAVKGVPLEILDSLKAKFASASASAKDAADSVRSTSDSLKSLSDTQLLKANQALAAYRQQAVDTAAAVRATLDSSASDDARYKALASAGAQFGMANSGGGKALTDDETAAKQAQLKVLRDAAVARDQERRATLEATAAQNAAVAAAQAEQESLRRLLGQIDPVNAGLERLDKLEAQLKSARSKGAIGADDFAAYAAKIDQSRSALTKADQTTSHFTLSTAGARREIGVMIGEIAQGNFGNFQNSLATLASRSGLLAGALSPIGAIVGAVTAAVLVLGAAAISGANDEEKLNQAIVSTGNYASASIGQVNQLALTIGKQTRSVGESRTALELLIASGKVTGDRLAEAAQGAVDFSTVTGQSIDKSVEFFAKLQDDPVKAIQELDAQYHILTLTQYENIKALEAQGDASSAAAIAQTAAAQTFAQRAAEVRQNQGLIERGWDEIKESASAAWDAMKGVGRTSSNQDDVANATRELDAFRARMPQLKNLSDDQLLQAASSPSDPNHAYLAGDLGAIQQLMSQKQRAQAGALMEQWEAQNDADYARINADGKKASDTMSKYLEEAKAAQAKAAEVAKVKEATQLLIKGNPANTSGYLADEKVALAQIDKKYTNHDAASANHADESSQVAAFKASLAAMTDAYKNSQAELETARKAGSLSEADYYKQATDLLWQNESDQVTAIQAEINRLQTRKAIGAERIKLDSRINQLEAEASKIEADTISKSDQLADQEKAGVDKRTAAYNAFADALDLTVQNQQKQIDAQVASIGMGDREYQQQQALNKIDADYAKQLQDLAKLKDKPVDAGGLDPVDYQRRVDKINADHAQMVQQQVDGFARINAARADWENGLTKGYRNWADEATNVAGEVASATTNVFDGFANATVQALNGGKNAWHDFAVSVLEDIEKIAVKLAEQQAVAAILSAFGIGGGSASGYGDALNGGSSYTGSGSLSTSWAGEGGGWSFNAKGGVYDSPSLSAYSGGIYDSPHLFKFASGAGVFGEAGPEAIMPLKRGADGRLGIASSGGSGDIYFTQSISIASDGTSSVDQNTNSEAMRQFGDSMRAVAQGEISRAIQPGGQIWRLRNGSGGR